jgi:hypothetical protein
LEYFKVKTPLIIPSIIFKLKKSQQMLSLYQIPKKQTKEKIVYKVCEIL